MASDKISVKAAVVAAVSFSTAVLAALPTATPAQKSIVYLKTNKLNDLNYQVTNLGIHLPGVNF